MEEEAQKLWIIPTIITLIAILFILFTSALSPKLDEVKMEDVLAEVPLAAIVFGWIILIQQVRNDPKIFNPLLGGSVLMFFGFLDDILDEIYEVTPLFMGLRVESFIVLGLLLCLVGFWFWVREYKKHAIDELTSKNLKSIAQQLQEKNGELANKNKEIEIAKKKMEKVNTQLSQKNKQLDQALDDLYSLRISLERNLTETEKKANKNFLKRLKKVKGKG